jgi:hypothetical protein
LKGTEEVKNEFDGYLFLTTDRLVFVASYRSFLSYNYRVKFAFPYEEIVSLGTGNYVFSTFVQVTTQAGNIYRFKPSANSRLDSELKIASKIKELSIRKKARIESESKKARVQLVLDFSFLRPLAEKGLSLHALRCPYCGGKIDELPNTGNIYRCQYCSNNVYAIDIYREINRLLGYSIDQITSSNVSEKDSNAVTNSLKSVSCKYYKSGRCENIISEGLAESRQVEGCLNLDPGCCCQVCSERAKCDIACEKQY